MIRKEFQGTPRPWKQGKKDRLRISGADNSDVADVLLDDDAMLIAAAPELLEALQSLVETIDNGGTMSNCDFIFMLELRLARAKEAISQALGNEPPKSKQL